MLRQIRSAFTSLFGKTTSTGNASAQQVTVIDPGVFSVDGEKAMKVSAVFSAVKIISEGIARLPLEAERYNAAAKCYVPDFSTPLFRALRLRPNNDLTAFELWRAAVQCMLLYGNAYIVPTRNALGDVLSLTLLAPGTTTFDVYSRTYNVNDNVNGIFRTFRPEEVVHLRNVGLDGGYTGCSTVAMAGYALGILRLADKNSATTLTTGGRTRGFLSGETQGFGGASEAQLADVAKRVEGDINSGKTVVPVPSSMKYQTFTLSPADAKVLESKQMTIRDIARFFRVHPDLLYEGSNNTYKAAEVPNVMFLTQTLEPLLVQIEQELAVKLLPANMLGKKRLRFDRERLYSTDLLTEASYNEKMLQTGMYTVNELRQKKGLPPLANGDVALVSANLKGLKEIINENGNGQKEDGNTIGE